MGDVERWPRLSEVRGADDVTQLRPPTPSNACEGLRSQRNSQGGQKANGGAELRQEPHSLAKGLSENTGGGAGRGLRRWPAWFLGPRRATAGLQRLEQLERPDHASAVHRLRLRECGGDSRIWGRLVKGG